jgi:6-pyruvoyltetrahydropterin/6-carboxytetrahydropterin synthase
MLVSLLLERRYRFSAAHRYHRPEWSAEENWRRFGKCSYDPGHGHNYSLVVRVAGKPDAETGFIVDLVELDRLVTEHVLSPLDHHHVNHAIDRFGPGGEVPSSENLVLWIRDQLRPHFGADTKLVSLELREDEDLGAIWTAPADSAS